MKYLLIPALLLIGGAAEAQQLAFPGAVGFGRFAEGGRGGTVYEVTTLADGVPAPAGSLRACIEASGPRTCVFRVGGRIVTDGANLNVTNPFLTIAGQTAPPPGITIETGCSLGGAALSVLSTATDTIVRFITLHADQRRSPCGSASSSRDALWVAADDTIIDHVSMRYGADENMGLDSCSVTVQWSIFAWGLEVTGHPSGNHSKGLRGSGPGAPPWTGFLNCSVTLAYNYFAHANDRMPQVDRYPYAQIVNNIQYDTDGAFGEYRAESAQVARHNQIGNICQVGPENTGTIPPCISIRPLDSLTPGTAGDTGTFEVYISDVVAPVGGAVAAVVQNTGGTALPLANYLVGTPHAMPTMPTYSTTVLDSILMPRVGSSLFRDAGDRLVIRNYEFKRAGANFQLGSIIDSPAEATIDLHTVYKMATEWLQLPQHRKQALTDSDRDGMPDSWEKINPGLDPLDPSDGAQITVSGYSNLEEYLHFLVAPVAPPPP